jgi:hypothetical protein
VNDVQTLESVLDDRRSARGVTPRALIAEAARQRSRGDVVLAEQAWRQAVECISAPGLTGVRLELAVERMVERAMREAWR